MSQKIVQNWMSLAEYDYKTAEAMLKSGRYLYVAFTCQQTIEKSLKAIYIQQNKQTPPYTHNLIRLSDAAQVKVEMDPDKVKFLELLNSYYIESRYTEELDELSRVITRAKANDILTQTTELFKWLKTYLQLKKKSEISTN